MTKKILFVVLLVTISAVFAANGKEHQSNGRPFNEIWDALGQTTNQQFDDLWIAIDDLQQQIDSFFDIFVEVDVHNQNITELHDRIDALETRIAALEGAAQDNDLDGFTADVDCDDADASVNPGATEICSDNKDNNCDGNVDENCSSCSSGLTSCNGQCVDVNNDANNCGACGNVCSSGVCDQGVCLLDADNDGYTSDVDCDDADASINPGATDLCNGIDDNCDGADGSDEAWFGASCDGGDADLCTEGTFTCNAGLQVCTDTTDDSVEVCNGLDDDCDGTVDENLGGASCDTGLLGVCSAGTEVCSNGGITCVQNTQATTETCGDTLDNDCDGIVDEGC